MIDKRIANGQAHFAMFAGLLPRSVRPELVEGLLLVRLAIRGSTSSPRTEIIMLTKNGNDKAHLDRR